MHHTVVHFEIPAEEPERAIEFYTKLFGWQITPWSVGDTPPMYWMVSTVPTDASGKPVRQGVNGALMKRHHLQQPFANSISVENIDESIGKAVGLGGQVALPKTAVPGMGYFAYFKDPEGNIIGLWNEDPRAS